MRTEHTIKSSVEPPGSAAAPSRIVAATNNTAITIPRSILLISPLDILRAGTALGFSEFPASLQFSFQSITSKCVDISRLHMKIASSNGQG